ncbi:uncharacterized protein LOC107036591 [Diachasma alloeum]|uniref:uncharacterized protein LOC107036591 n=1 Tax=Diachasma alloeum TaxID=454923 RepID=UPI0007383644|nr:uncharacterized protein LOC107036591 [Diachasma alloeum]
MWILKDESDKLYYLTPSQPFIIGRNQGDLIVKSDTSLSRAHAKIDLLPPFEKCQVTDTKSKYGTFLLDDDSEVIKQIDDVYTVRSNDRIRFGLQNCILTFTQQKFIVSTTSLSPEHREELVSIMKEIGGTTLKEWDSSCTHLTVTTTKLTAKLACSLAAGISIVTIDYWRSVRTAKAKGEPLPDPKDFCPGLEDSMLVKKNKSSLLPRASRRSLFKDFLFIHFRVNQLETYRKMIELAGGSSVFYGDKCFDKELLSHPNSRVILYNEDDSQDEPYKIPAVDAVRNFLRKKKRRMIPETEIPLAILYSSVKSYCNPDFSYEMLFKSGREKRVVEGDILVAETQEGEEQKRFGGRKGFVPESLVIPETESFGDGESQRDRRGRKRSSAGSIVRDEVVDDCGGRGERKRSREMEDGDTGEKEKRARIAHLPLESDKLAERTCSTLKSDEIPAKGIFDDSGDDFEDPPAKKSKNDGKIAGKSRLDIEDFEDLPVKKTKNNGKILGKNGSDSEDCEDVPVKKTKNDGKRLGKSRPDIEDSEDVPVKKTKNDGKRLGKNRPNIEDSEDLPVKKTKHDGKILGKSRPDIEDFEDLAVKKTKNDGKILGKSRPDIPKEKVIDNDKTIGRKNESRNDNDFETIKTPAKNAAAHKSGQGGQRNASPEENKKPSRFLEVSDGEMEIVKEPIDEEIDGDEDEEWKSHQNKISKERLRSFLGDEKSMQNSFLRPEVFSGKFIGKKFKKFHSKIPQRPVIEWKRGL